MKFKRFTDPLPYKVSLSSRQFFLPDGYFCDGSRDILLVMSQMFFDIYEKNTKPDRFDLTVCLGMCIDFISHCCRYKPTGINKAVYMRPHDKYSREKFRMEFIDSNGNLYDVNIRDRCRGSFRFIYDLDYQPTGVRLLSILFEAILDFDIPNININFLMAFTQACRGFLNQFTLSKHNLVVRDNGITLLFGDYCLEILFVHSMDRAYYMTSVTGNALHYKLTEYMFK